MNEFEILTSALEAIRKEQSEIADHECEISYEEWREIYGLENAPGYLERNGEF